MLELYIYIYRVQTKVQYSAPAIKPVLPIEENVEKHYYKLDVESANTCPAGQNIQTQTECQIAFLKVVALETIKPKPNTWVGSAGHVPYGCGFGMDGDRYLRQWNLDSNGKNNGNYYKLCKGSQ